MGVLVIPLTQTGGSLGGAFGGHWPALEGVWGHPNSAPLLGAPVRFSVSAPQKLEGPPFPLKGCPNFPHSLWEFVFPFLPYWALGVGGVGWSFPSPNLGGPEQVTTFPPNSGCSGGFPISPEFWGVRGCCPTSPPVGGVHGGRGGRDTGVSETEGCC